MQFIEVGSYFDVGRLVRLAAARRSLHFGRDDESGGRD